MDRAPISGSNSAVRGNAVCGCAGSSPSPRPLPRGEGEADRGLRPNQQLRDAPVPAAALFSG